LLVGIAGGFPARGVNRGDVVIAHVIHSFDYGKLVDGTFLRRPDNDFNCDRLLLTWADIVAKRQVWRTRIPQARPNARGPEVSKAHVECYIASSNKVVDDPDHAWYAAVLAAFPEIHAVEMEGVGAGASARLAQIERPTGLLMIRGISDEPGSSAESGIEQRASWKAYAAATAAAFTGALIEELPKHSSPPPTPAMTKKEILRTAFSFLFFFALVWVALRMFWDFESVSPDERSRVVLQNMWMLFPVGLFVLPLTLLNEPFGMKLMWIFESLPEHIGVVAIFMLVITFCLSLLWLFTPDAASKRLLACGALTAFGAAIGAAIQKQFTKVSAKP